MALRRGPPISDTLVSALGQSKACPFNGENLRSTPSQQPFPGSPMRPLRELRARPWTRREEAWGQTQQREEESGPVKESSSRLRDVTILVPKFARKCCHRSKRVRTPSLECKSHMNQEGLHVLSGAVTLTQFLLLSRRPKNLLFPMPDSNGKWG